MRTENFDGEKIGNWSVIGPISAKVRRKRKVTYYPCRCICGEERLVEAVNLRYRRSLSCGCCSRKGK